MTPRRSTRALLIHPYPSPTDIGLREITRAHRMQGYLAVGFHYVIRRDGTVEQGRPESLIGAHNRRRDRDTVGICLIGEDAFTAAQRASLEGLIADLLTRYPDAEVLGDVLKETDQ